MTHEFDSSKCWAQAARLDALGDRVGAASICASFECSGVLECQQYLGWYYFELGDFETSFTWYAKAARVESEETLEDCWRVILRVDAGGEKENAIRMCESEPLSRYIKSQRYLFNEFFARGEMERALHWCLQATSKGAPFDLLCAGIIYRHRDEPFLALEFFQRAVAAGSLRANHLIGDIYAYGLGVPVDVQKAISYYELSASHGFLYGKTRLAHLKRSEGGAWAKFLFFFSRLPALILTLVALRLFKRNDERLADIPIRGTRSIARALPPEC